MVTPDKNRSTVLLPDREIPPRPVRSGYLYDLIISAVRSARFIFGTVRGVTLAAETCSFAVSVTPVLFVTAAARGL